MTGYARPIDLAIRGRLPVACEQLRRDRGTESEGVVGLLYEYCRSRYRFSVPIFHHDGHGAFSILIDAISGFGAPGGIGVAPAWIIKRSRQVGGFGALPEGDE